MSTPKHGADWKPNDAGVLVPPGTAPAAHVVRAEFAVKVAGFKPPEPGFQWPDGAQGWSQKTAAKRPR